MNLILTEIVQLEYAALDAAVLIHLFRHVRDHPGPPHDSSLETVQWKSHIVSSSHKCPYLLSDNLSRFSKSKSSVKRVGLVGMICDLT